MSIFSRRKERKQHLENLAKEAEMQEKYLHENPYHLTTYKDGYSRAIDLLCCAKEIGEISDGYHTFNELYEFRLLYNAALFNMLAKYTDIKVLKSYRHHDGEECFGGTGWFIVQAELPTGQISNHYENKYWDYFNIPEQETADVWDGHTEVDVIERLTKFVLSNK